MSEPNPYQPPQTPGPLTQVQVTKRAIGVGAILLLAPVAVAIAFTMGCTVMGVFPRAAHPLWDAIVRWGVGFLPPFIALYAMMGWAAQAHCRQKPRGQRGSRVAILLLTPIAVAVATAAGAWLAYGVVAGVSGAQGGVDSTAVLLGMAAFVAPPLLTLVGMLLAAWRNGGP